MSSTDLELFKRVLSYDSKALEALYNRYSPLLYTLIKNIVKDVKSAEEILSDVFAIIWKKNRSFNFDTGNVYTWIVTLTRNKAVDSMKRIGIDQSLEPYSQEYEDNFIMPHLSTVIDTADIKVTMEMKEKVEQAFNKLTDAQQYVIHLAYYEGLNEQEIASKLRIPLPTVKSKIKLTLSNLKENLASGDSKNISDLLYAYALGCLGKEDYLKIQEQIKNKADFPWKELGEYQNLTALLPLALKIENPDIKLKDKVARNLYRIKREIVSNAPDVTSVPKEQEEKNNEEESITEQASPLYKKYDPQLDGGFEEVAPKKTVEKESTDEIKISPAKDFFSNAGAYISKSEPDKKFDYPPAPEKPEDQLPISNEYLPEPEHKASPEHQKEIEYPLNPDYGIKRKFDQKRIQSRKVHEENTYPEKEIKKKNTGILAAVIFFILSIAAILIMYLIFSDALSNNKSELEQIKKEVNQLKSSANNNKPVLDILNSPNSMIINLKSADSTSSFGKILLDHDSKTAFIKLTGMPVISEDKIFQLWINNSGNYTSIGVFRPSPNEYISIPIENIPANKDIQFIISEEFSGRAVTNGPEGRIILVSSI